MMTRHRAPMVAAALGGLLGALALAGPAPAAPAAAEQEASGPPAWFVSHMAFMTRDGGRWITDNSAYKSDTEPFDAYGLEWSYGLGEQSLTGRLFALKDGKEVATFWEFRAFWHPGEDQVKIYQFAGNGMVGIGTMESAGGSATTSDQEFFHPDGSRRRDGHRTEDTEEGHHITRSFNIGGDGEWTPRRTYTWKRVS